MPTDEEKHEKNAQQVRTSKVLANSLLSLGFSVITFVIIGVVLDNVFKTTPTFILVGVFFALASMGYFMWKAIKAQQS